MKSPNPGGLKPELRAELLDLLSSLCSENLNVKQTKRLEAILENNGAAQAIYSQYMTMHAELFWLQHSVIPSQSASKKEGIGRPTLPGSRVWQWPLSLAAVLLIGFGLGWVLNAPDQSPSPTAGQAAALVSIEDRANPTPERSEVAKITGSLNCRWNMASGQPPLGFGSSLEAGRQLKLIEGVAEITFQNGARMLLQAPAQLDVDSLTETNLHHGRLTATCPPGAEGFRVHTEGLTLVDLGTEFGVMADEAGNTEIHVFEGLVEGQYRETDNGPVQKIQWRTNQTAHFDNETNQVIPRDQPETSFVRTLSPNLGPVSGLVAGEEFDYPVGPLGGQNGGFGWGGPWQNLSVESGAPKTNAVAAGSLRYGILSGSGNHANLKGQFNRIRRVLSTSFGGIFDTAGFIEDQDGARLIGRDGKTLYLSFSQRVDQLDQVFYGFELNRGDGNKNRVICIGHAAAKAWKDGEVRAPNKEAGVTGWAVTSEFNGTKNSLLEIGDLGPETDGVTLFVVKLSFGPGNRDRIDVYQNPESLWDEQQCSPDVIGFGNFAFDRISLANFEGEKDFEVDHIRVGTSFSAVTRPLWQAEPANEREDSVGALNESVN